MAAGFEKWTVLAHEPLNKFEDNLWHVEGVMPDGKTRRHMTLARMRDGRVVVHNAIALEDELMKQLDAWGEPAFIVVPNGFHRQDAKIWKDRYPQAKVLAPKGHSGRIAKAVPLDGGLDALPADDDVSLTYLDGCKTREGIVTVKSGGRTTVIFTDAVLNMPKMGGLFGFLLGPTGHVSVPRIAKMLIASDKRAFRGHLDRIASDGALARLIFGHGRPLLEAPGDSLRAAAAAIG